MKIPDGFFIIYQPKYKVPCVFDLHARGVFKTRPFVTETAGFRVLGDQWAQVKLQCAWLTENRTSDKRSGRAWEFSVEERLLDLDQNLMPDPEALEEAVSDKSFRDRIIDSLDAWRTGYLPPKGKDYDRGLKEKILSSIRDHKARLRNELVHKNHNWIMAGLPRRLQDFKRYLYPAVREQLFPTYQKLGGESDEAKMIRHLVLFSHIFDHEGTDQFSAHNWGGLRPEDHAWECWSGFTGSEDESRRLCSTMDEVFRPLNQKLTAEDAVDNPTTL